MVDHHLSHPLKLGHKSFEESVLFLFAQHCSSVEERQETNEEGIGGLAIHCLSPVPGVSDQGGNGEDGDLVEIDLLSSVDDQA